MSECDADFKGQYIAAVRARFAPFARLQLGESPGQMPGIVA